MEWLVWSHLAESQKLLLPSQPITNRVKTIRLDQNPSLKILKILRVVTILTDFLLIFLRRFLINGNYS